MPTASPPFATWLASAMRGRGLSQASLARELGVADAQVSRWRRGQVVPSVRYLQRLSDAFGVPRATLDQLAGYPVEAAARTSEDPRDDPGAAAERQALEAWHGQILQERVPRRLWRSYADACAALADIFATAVERLPSSDEARPADEPGRPGSIGFGR